MKQVVFLVLAILISTVSMQAQAAPDAGDLTKLLNEFLAGAGRNDAAIHDRFWAEDLIYTRSAGVRTNKLELMSGVRSAPPPKPDDPVTVYTADDIKIQQYGDAAVVAFVLVSTTTRPDGTKTVGHNLNTGTFIKRGGRWQVVAWQSTAVPKPTEIKACPAVAPEIKPAAAEKPASASRKYLKGPRGGCYYLNSGGDKVYVDKSFCS